ncbi:MAG: P-II family nitrogen regulator [Opitutaceae bacterium]|nr:P-II family nitrogen regulator [Opitutaceae bacterium]
MKLIIAFIRPSKEEDVREALHAVPGLSGASFSDIRGFGRGRGHSFAEAEREAVVGTLPRVRVEVMVPDAAQAAAEQAIASAAHTGQRGDGKIYALSLDSARRISSGETAETAV